jgi:hypothetical protein
MGEKESTCMAITSPHRVSTRGSFEPIIPQGTIERAFPDTEACTARIEFAKAEPDTGDRFYMERGIVTGALAEHEVQAWTQDRGFTIEFSSVVDELLVARRCMTLSADQLAAIRTFSTDRVRDLQRRFPPEDDGLPWIEMVSLSPPQLDYFVRRPDRFRLRVRPDAVVGVGTTIVGLEFSTAKDPAGISPARFALNHHALTRARLAAVRDDPDGPWAPYTAVATRVEMLALGYGFTVQLTAEDAETWRVKIGEAAEALVARRYEPRRGPWCSTCRWQLPCWDGDSPDVGPDF